MLKRLIDLAIAIPALVISSPLIILLIVLIRIGSPGPAILRQTRVGRNQVPFTCYKLRTMWADTKALPSHEVGQAAITPIGSRIRKVKLDELPQLWNVVRGEMSLVGPRPCLPTQSELIAAREANGIFQLLPGITGSAQVLGIDMSDPERLAQVEFEYSRNRSAIGDLRILFQTIAGAGIGADPSTKSNSHLKSPPDKGDSYA